MYEKPESKIINDFMLSGYKIQYIHTVHVVKGRVQRNHHHRTAYMYLPNEEQSTTDNQCRTHT